MHRCLCVVLHLSLLLCCFTKTLTHLIWDQVTDWSSLWRDLLWSLGQTSLSYSVSGLIMEIHYEAKGSSCFQVYMLVCVAAIILWLTVFAAVIMYWRTISLFVPKSFSLSGVFFSSLRFISSWKYKPHTSEGKYHVTRKNIKSFSIVTCIMRISIITSDETFDPNKRD